MENNKKFINLLVLMIFVIVLLIGSVVYLYIKNKQLNQSGINNPTTQEISLNTTSQQSTTQVKNKLPNINLDDLNNLKDELVKTKFELAILKFWQVREVFRNPNNKNQFYYLSEDGSGASIWVYDLTKDKTYQQNNSFNISEGNALLLNQKLAQYQEFRGVGIIDNKFIFTETSSDNSPGPCFSPWFYRNLEYIDIGVLKPVRKPFSLPEDLKAKEEQKSLDCQKTL